MAWLNRSIGTFKRRCRAAGRRIRGGLAAESTTKTLRRRIRRSEDEQRDHPGHQREHERRDESLSHRLSLRCQTSEITVNFRRHDEVRGGGMNARHADRMPPSSGIGSPAWLAGVNLNVESHVTSFPTSS